MCECVERLSWLQKHMHSKLFISGKNANIYTGTSDKIYTDVLFQFVGYKTYTHCEKSNSLHGIVLLMHIRTI